MHPYRTVTGSYGVCITAYCFMEYSDMAKITWSAKNNSSYLNGQRTATSILAAVRAARAYVRGELYGEGTLTIYADGHPVRQDERSIFTGYRWSITDLKG